MRAATIILLSSLLIMLAMAMMPMQSSHAQDPCSGLVPTRLAPDQTARVVYDGDGLGSALRDAPGKEQSGSNLVGNIPEGTVVTTLSGPICLDGMVWWQISLTDGRQFWVGEGDSQRYYLEPFTLGTEITRARQENPRSIERWSVSYTGEVEALPTLSVPDKESFTAIERWQPDDINAANDALNIRREQCPEVLIGTPWEGLSNAADVVVEEGDFTYVAAPTSGRVLLFRHWLLPMPTCGGSPGKLYGISTVHFIQEERDSIDLFPYGQHGGTRSRTTCLSPDVSDQAWTTFVNDVQWSPDNDTAILSVRYLDQDPANAQRDCAFYFIFLVDVYNANVQPIAEGRRAFWGSGGTRLYYFMFETDNAYNVLSEQLWLLSEGESTQLNVNEAEGVQFVPPIFNSTGTKLPATADGDQILVCNYPTGCPEVVEFNIARRQFSEPLPIPDELEAREIAAVHYIANNTRLLWLSTDGGLFVQSLTGPDRSYWSVVGNIPGNRSVVAIHTIPTGIAVVLELDNGDFMLMNTLSREIQPLVLP